MVLRVENLTKQYGTNGIFNKALDRISFQVEKGEFVGIMGPSGSGKTTLLNCISTIDMPTSGSIFINGTNINNLNRDRLSDFRQKELGFIFQDFNLLDTLTAFENIALALTIRDEKASNIKNRIREVAQLLDIQQILNKYPYQISGGQKQRVACARALITKPSIILADEPTGALDSKSSGMLLQAMEGMNQKAGATIVMVTHDAFSASYTQRILFIKDGDIAYELPRQQHDSRQSFFQKIIAMVSKMGGDNSNVF